MKRLTLALAAAAAVLTSAACTGPTPSSAPELPATASSGAGISVAATPAGANEQGRLEKKVGETAGFGASAGGGEAVVSFSIDKITVDPKCAPYSKRPEGTHTLVLDLRVATKTLADDDAIQLGATINVFAFQVITDGVTTPAQAGICKVSQLKKLPDSWASNSKYSGQIELEVPSATGTLALVPGGLANTGGGWEWKY